MVKYMVTLNSSTGVGKVKQCCAPTATINGKPIVTVGAVASHPYGSDVLIEGIPTILLNGQPIAFSTGKTAMGGVLQPNTSVKIGIPESYTGFISSPKVDTEGQSPKEKPKGSEEVKLESDFAWKQIQWQAKNEGKLLFQIHMAMVFGADISAKALDRLYTEANEGTIDNPPIIVCRNRICGTLSAAYDNDSHCIYVAENFVKEAIEYNDVRHQLLAALVEEFGHHVDYLLRFVYDKNISQDTEGDEGARYAYRSRYDIFNIHWDEEPAVFFATASTPKGNFRLEWNYDELHDALQKYTADRQTGTDDHIGNLEGFLVEDLSAQHGFGHINIQREALRKMGNSPFRKYETYLERGNWLRDYSQIITPAIFKLADEVNREMSSALASCPSSLFKNQGQKILHSVFSHDLVKKSLVDVVRILTLHHFVPKNREGIIYRKDYTNWRDIVEGDNGLIPGFKEALGVSVCYEHCDNPKGLEDNKAYTTIDGCASFNHAIASEANITDTTYGTKKYLRCASDNTGDNVFGVHRTVYQHLDKELNEIRDKWYRSGQSDEVSNKKLMVRFGGVLHTLQDFFAHSNYTEICMAQHISDKIITWTESDGIWEYTSVRLSNPSRHPFTPVLREQDIRRILDRESSFGSKPLKHAPYSPEVIERACNTSLQGFTKAFFSPVTSGTFDGQDMLVSFMHMFHEMLNNFYFRNTRTEGARLKSGELSRMDVTIMGILETFGEVAGKTNGISSFAMYLYNRYLDMRELKYKEILGVSIDKISQKTEEVKDYIKKFMPFIEDWRNNLDYLQHAIFSLLIYFLIKLITEILFTYISQITLSLKDSTELLKMATTIDFKGKSANEVAAALYGLIPAPKPNAKYYYSPFARYMRSSDPSHTMMAKDAAGHPVNELAGMMAVAATSEVLSRLELNQELPISEIINHPLHSHLYDDRINRWINTEQNLEKILRASLSVCFFENILACVALSFTHRKMLNKLQAKEDNYFFILNKIIKFFSNSTTQLAQVFVDKLNKDVKSLTQLLDEAISAYKSSAYCYLDSETFVSLSASYIKRFSSRFYRGDVSIQTLELYLMDKDNRKEIQQIWQEMLLQNLDRYKKDVLNGNWNAKLNVPTIRTVAHCHYFTEMMNRNHFSNIK